ncbi:RING finger protein 141-like isoform X2 [Zootermopsis nevadensis]|nr:RING finger protein 141-like isoform X2 [Zootermopsis nevadensis]XP_021926623.1 RING finger protein 141-like isoform X2 [Zootermopsis nevadensis]
MGQAGSSDNVIPETVENIQEDICRHARVFSEIASLTYQDFQSCLGKLNTLLKQCVDSNGKQLIFIVKKGTDSTLLWKGTVRIACVKLNPLTNKVDTYRLLNLSEFLKVFRTLQCQLAAARQSSLNSSSSEASASITGGTSLPSLMDQNLLTATMLFEEVESSAGCYSGTGERLNECCICLERKPDVMLPCAHSYCMPCIEQWNVNNKTCPICRETLDSTDDTWVISEVPGSHEISEEIFCSLMDLAASSATTPT